MSNIIKLSDVGGDFSLIPEGTYNFTVTSVEYKSDFGKLNLQYTATNGQVFYDRYGLKNSKGGVNTGANKAFSFTAKSIMGDFSMDAIDPDELLDMEFTATVVHHESDAINDKTGEPYVNARLENYKVGHSEIDDSDESDDEDDFDFEDDEEYSIEDAQDEFDF